MRRNGRMGTDLIAAIEEFNRYRRPEIRARLVNYGEGRAEIVFTGTACGSCGGQDYLDDFTYEATDLMKVPVTLIEFERTEGGDFRAKFLIGGKDSP